MHIENNQNNPDVSICCITFNQERFIKTAIESFINQDFDGTIEIIIVDDCSTDNTAKEIEFYISQGHNIRYFRNETNLGMMRNLEYALSLCKGQYVAICEGDDFFVSINKIQMQTNYMRKNLDCNFMIHDGIFVDEYNNYKKDFLIPNKNFLNASDALLAEWQLAPTSSYFIRRDSLALLPMNFSELPLGDLFLEIYIGRNKIGFIREKLSAYRFGNTGSWSNKKKSYHNLLQYYLKYYDELHKAKIIIQGYEKQFDIKLNNIKYNICINLLKTKQYKMFASECRKLTFDRGWRKNKKIKFLLLKISSYFFRIIT